MLTKELFWQWFKQEVKPRWSRSEFSGVEMGDWYWRLGEFDIETITQAVRRHKACEDYKTPSLKKVYAYAKAIGADKRPRQPRSEGSGVPESHVYIMCVAKDFDGCGPVGRYLPVLMWPFGKTCTAEQYRRNAEAFAKKHADFYGGVWEVFTQTRRLEIMRQSTQLRGIKAFGAGIRQ